MHAARIHEHGDPEVIRIDDVPTPEPSPGEVLVKVLAASINHLDLWVRRGMPGFDIPFPRVLGSDGTAEVVSLGEGVDGFEPGQKVVILPGVCSAESERDMPGREHLARDYGIRGEHCDGVDCEYAVLEARYLLPLPDGVDPVQAAAVPLVFLTAHTMLVLRADLQAGETVLVLGGASGVGSAAIQIAKDRGARVIATAGSEEKLALARELGADEAVDHRDEAWGKEIKRLSEGRGCDVVVEHVGPATWKASAGALASNGRLVTCGGTTGAVVQVVLPHLFVKNLSILGSSMGPRASFPEIFAKVAEGAYRPVVDRVLPLSDAREAHRRLEAREAVGKILLVPGA